MERLSKLFGIFFAVFLCVFAGSVGLKTGKHNNFQENLGISQGTVIAYEQGLLIVSFDKPVINACGDTQIYGFITTPDDFTVQLKPVFIPAAKAGKINEETLVFPVWDIMAFLQDPGAYTIEFYVDNNCSLLHKGTVTLPPVPLVLGSNGGENG